MRLAKEAGRQLWEARERLGLSRAALEARTAEGHYRVPEATIFNIEKGVSKAPYPRTIYALAEALDLDASPLFETEEVAS
jgi:transcriptional regulator with XRE-family HTH domain